MASLSAILNTNFCDSSSSSELLRSSTSTATSLMEMYIGLGLGGKGVGKRVLIILGIEGRGDFRGGSFRKMV